MLINPEDIIDVCYETLLQRPSDLEGKQYYLSQMRSGQPFQQILKSFLESLEFKQILQKEDFTQPSAHGVLVKTDYKDSYLLYPAFDQVQLKDALEGNPFALTDFLACMNFLQEHDYLTSEKPCFLDLGANVGSTSVYALKGDFFEQAICIEASTLNYQFLNFNAQINQLTQRLHPLNYGLANFNVSGSLVCNPNNCGDFRVQPITPVPTKNLFNEENYTKELVDFTTLDALMQQNILRTQEISFIWIDCQGSESLIFSGGEKFFAQVAAPLYVEFWPYGINRLTGRTAYLDFIEQYSREIWRLVDGKFQLTTLDFLRNFYEQNVETGEYIDILVLPKL